jgi:hypothetical protein
MRATWRSTVGDVCYVRTVNLIEGAPTIEVTLGDTVVASVAYGRGSGFNAVPCGNADLSMKAASTSADDGGVIDLSSETSTVFLKETAYTLIAYGELAAPHLFTVEAWGQRDSVEDGKVVLQFAHAAPNAPRLDVYVTAAEAGITISRYVATLGLGEASVPLELTLARHYEGDSLLTGEVVIEVRARGAGRVVYRSPEISVVERHRVLFAIGDARGEAGAPMRLVSVDVAVPGG